jgi:hypothetical protein
VGTALRALAHPTRRRIFVNKIIWGARPMNKITFITSKIVHIKTETLEWIAYIVAIIGFPLLIASTFIAIYQIHETNRAVSAQNNIALNTMVFNSDKNSAIIDAIEKGDKILKENGGKFLDSQLDSYLGDYETIFQAYDEGYLSEDELCTSFSYYVAAIFKNKEIQDYMSGKENEEFFEGLSDLNKLVQRSKNRNCH